LISVVLLVNISEMFVQGGGGWNDKTPLQKYRAFQAYRVFLSREPPKALGSKEIPQVTVLTVIILLRRVMTISYVTFMCIVVTYLC